MKIKIPLTVLSHKDDGGYHLLIKGYINDKKVNLILDTGASSTVFDKSRLTGTLKNIELKSGKHQASGLGTNKMEAHTAVLKKFRVGKLEIKNCVVGILDLSHVNIAFEQLNITPIDGILGGNFLMRYKAVIDYHSKKLTLKTKKKK